MPKVAVLEDDELPDDTQDLEALRRHSKRLLSEKKKLQQRTRELEEKLRIARGGPPKRSPAVDDFMAEAAQRLSAHEPGGEAWKAAFAKIEQGMEPLLAAERAALESRYQAELQEQETVTANLTREQEVWRIAGELAANGVSAKLLVPHLLERVAVQRRGEEWDVEVRDRNGKPTTVDGLREELGADPGFARVVRGPSEADQAEHARKVAEMLGKVPPPQGMKYTRAEFEQLSHEARSAAIAGGARVVDH